MSPVWTIRSLLAWITQDFAAQGIGTPRLDAEVLLAHTLGCDRVRLYMDLDRPLTPDELSAVRALVLRRRKREPVAYIVGQREFYRRPFLTTSAVLIPRPDTETLVERALLLMAASEAPRVLDLCTGSGAIAVTLAAEHPGAHVDATDLSAAALQVGKSNAARHGVSERISFYEGDLFGALSLASPYDLIVSNPPYIRAADYPTLAAEITDYEPKLALVAGDDGLSVLRRLCMETEGWLVSGGSLFFEVGAGQAQAVAAWLGERPLLHEVRIHKDLGSVERVVEARRRS